MRESITLTITSSEATELANIIDLAVRSGGVVTAKTAMKFIALIEVELSKPEPEPVKPNA